MSRKALSDTLIGLLFPALAILLLRRFAELMTQRAQPALGLPG